MKGLEGAVADVWPRAARRNCVQHIYANFKKDHKEQELRDSLWYIARCTNEEMYKRAMTRLEQIHPAAHRWIKDNAGSPEHWCKAFFSQNLKSDMLCNNLSELFNAFILEARDKPLITMLESIRSSVMEIIVKRRVAMSKVKGTLCPKIKKILDSNVHKSVGFSHKWNGKSGF